MSDETEWTQADISHAWDQGWAIFNENEIQRLDSENVFPHDESALDFVLNHAATDPVCRKAIRICYGF